MVYNLYNSMDAFQRVHLYYVHFSIEHSIAFFRGTVSPKGKKKHCSMRNGENDAKGTRLNAENPVALFYSVHYMKKKNENQLGGYCSNQVSQE